MSRTPPPNAALAELADVLGEDNVRTLVRTFLRDFPVSLASLGSPASDRKNRHRLAHSMKSNSRLVGALALSQRMAALELRLDDPAGADITQEDLAAIEADFQAIAGPLKAFVG